MIQLNLSSKSCVIKHYLWNETTITDTKKCISHCNSLLLETTFLKTPYCCPLSNLSRHVRLYTCHHHLQNAAIITGCCIISVFIMSLEGLGFSKVTVLISTVIPVLTLTVLNFWKFTSYCSLKPLRSGTGEVVPARTSPTLHPPSPPTVHQLSWLAL